MWMDKDIKSNGIEEVLLPECAQIRPAPINWAMSGIYLYAQVCQ